MTQITTPPTPSDVLNQIVHQVMQTSDASFMGAQSTLAKRQLVLKLVQEVYGKEDPLSQFCQHYLQADRMLYPVNLDLSRADAAEAELEEMQWAWDVIQQDISNQIQGIRDAFLT